MHAVLLCVQFKPLTAFHLQDSFLTVGGTNSLCNTKQAQLPTAGWVYNDFALVLFS